MAAVCAIRARSAPEEEGSPEEYAKHNGGPEERVYHAAARPLAKEAAAKARAEYNQGGIGSTE
eukprot:scaffold161988_cov34-Tisochrysis_lutea.AAC.5